MSSPAETDSKIIDGKAIAASIRQELVSSVADFKASSGVTPGLAVVLVGERRDSATYVRMKKKACDEIGIMSHGVDFASDVTQEELLRCVQELNDRSDIHGILVQLPLPQHIDERVVLEAISPEKDVDGLHPINVALLSTGRTRPSDSKGRLSWQFNDIDFHIACTPQGCIELLDRSHLHGADTACFAVITVLHHAYCMSSGVTIEGKKAVVLGRSNIVGIPVSMLLLHRNATVTIVHSRTVNTAEVVRSADIVVAAVGRAEMVKGAWIKEGAVVIDVGINSVDDASKKAGSMLTTLLPCYATQFDHDQRCCVFSSFSAPRARLLTGAHDNRWCRTNDYSYAYEKYSAGCHTISFCGQQQ
eukprot:11872-Heterococcus_DN1.PRE.1